MSPQARQQEVEEYKLPSGSCPFEEWLGELALDVRSIVRTRINRLRLGNFGDCKRVGEGVLELRIDYGPGYRVYLGRDGLSKVVLLCAGDKSSQAADIAMAKSYWTVYRS